MTSVDPEHLFQLLRQKINWGTLLTPVRKIAENFESFNTASKQTFLLNGMDLSGENLPECKDISGQAFENLTLDTKIKTIFANLTKPCLIREKDGTVSIGAMMELFHFDKPLEELVSKTGMDKDILKVLDQAKEKDQRFTKFNIGKINMSEVNKDILGLFTAFVIQEYDKSQTKDGKLKDNLIGEISVISSENKKYVEILDTTGLISNPKLCDVSDSEINNLLSVTTIKKVRDVDDKHYCVDFDMNKYYQQNRVLTIVTVPIDLKVKHVLADSEKTNTDMSENKMTELSSEMKKSVVDSYVGNYLNSFYNDPKKYEIEWIRLNDGVIMLKVTDNTNKNVAFHKFDATFAVLDKSECPEYKIDPKIKEFIRIQEFCKTKDKYKLKYALVGSDHSKFTGLKISKTQLEETKSIEDLEKFKDNFDQMNKISTYRTYRSYSGVCSSGNCGGYRSSGLYSYPYTYGNYWYGSYYVPPAVTSIIPTAPVITYTPYTYTYPYVTTSNYTLGSYYSPYTYYMPYSYSVPYTYVAPYTYSIPYTYYVQAEQYDVGSKMIRTKQNTNLLEDEFDKFHIVQRNKNIKKYLN